MIHIFSAFLMLIQRTEIQKDFKFLNKISKNFKGKLSLVPILLQSLSYNKVFRLYKQSLILETELLLDTVTNDFKGLNEIVVLDIGCGLGGYHLGYLSESSRPKVKLYLMDKSELNFDALEYGHGESDRFYNSLKVSKVFLDSKKSTDSEIYTVEAINDFPRTVPIKLDLVVSFISWGFHYPLEVYWTEILQKMRVNTSVLLIDIRKGSESHAFLYNQDNIEIKILFSHDKFDRVKIIKNKDRSINAI
jgi:hypothetical protein